MLLSNGNRIIITGFHPQRPINCYSGIKENGQGKEYIFGPKFRPVFIRHAGEDHPAVRLCRQRRSAQAGLTDDRKVVIGKLLDAVDAREWERAKVLAETVRSLLV